MNTVHSGFGMQADGKKQCEDNTKQLVENPQMGFNDSGWGIIMDLFFDRLILWFHNIIP
jgi:hypothetical protein